MIDVPAPDAVVSDIPSGAPARLTTPEPGDPRLARLSINQRSVPDLSLPELVASCRKYGILAVGLWREPVQEFGLQAAARLVRSAGLRVSSLCRVGFFADRRGSEWAASLEQARIAIEESAELGAECLPIVPGGLPLGDRDIADAIRRVRHALEELVPLAADRGVRLALEPLHPMLCADRGVVVSLGQALEVTAGLPAEVVGVAVDTYHLWWDHRLAADLLAAGTEGRIFAYQLSDWLPLVADDVLLQRGMLGDGSIDFVRFNALVDAAGYLGMREVEIFNRAVWSAAPDEAVATIVRRYCEIVGTSEA
jgi:sugar phosphate isomerase/epimerase